MKSQRVRRTLFLDIWHGVFSGGHQAFAQTMALVILLEVFLKPAGERGENLQALIASAAFLGMLGALFYESWSSRWQWRRATLLFVPILAASVCLLGAAGSDRLSVYVLCTCLALFLMPLRLPSMTDILQRNYPERRLGSYHARAMVATQLSSMALAFGAGLILDRHLGSWRGVLIVFALMGVVMAGLARRFPSTRVQGRRGVNPFRALRWVSKDKAFGHILAVWFLFGFANHWVIPIRVSYLAQGLELKPSLVTLLAGVIPEMARLLFVPLWARLFDRFNFIAVRMALNGFLGLGLVLYFTLDTVWGIGLGAFLHGVGFAGGRLAWQLWVTKMAPPERVSEYMSVNVFLTGLRGCMGPFIGFYVLSEVLDGGLGAYQSLGQISAAVMFLSILLFLPVLSQGRRGA